MNSTNMQYVQNLHILPEIEKMRLIISFITQIYVITEMIIVTVVFDVNREYNLNRYK